MLAQLLHDTKQCELQPLKGALPSPLSRLTLLLLQLVL
jgi:hypothetical protein